MSFVSTLESISVPEFGSVPLAGVTSRADLPHWLAIYVKHRHEKSVAASLQKRGSESFLPLHLRVSQDSKKSELPLFPGYVFCRSEIGKTLPILSTPGVFSIVGFGPTPAFIADQEIDGIKRLLRLGLKPQPWAYIAPGQQVCLKTGPLRGVEGVILNDDHQKWIVVSVHLLQRSVGVRIDRTYL